MRKVVVFFIFGFVFLQGVSGYVNVDIDVKSVFHEGDVVGFNYTIYSSESVNLNYGVNINCPGQFSSMIDSRQLSLGAGESFEGEYIHSMEEEFSSSRCIASVIVSSPHEIEKTEAFDIFIGKEFSFSIDLVNDSFFVGEDIFLGYKSSESDIEISANITNLDGYVREVDFPSSIRLPSPGEYKISAIARKEGYSDAFDERVFYVTDKDVEENLVKKSDGGTGKEKSSLNKDCGKECSVGFFGKVWMWIKEFFGYN